MDPVLLLLDERAGVAVARKLGLGFVGTLGLLVKAHKSRLLDFETSLTALQQTRFFLSERVIAHARTLL
jgi:predicted nucleic acid-binding protein